MLGSINNSNGQCLGHETISSEKADDQKELTGMQGATRAILQFVTGEADAEKVADKAIAMLSENGDVVPGYGAGSKGFLICNFGVYEVCGPQNLNGLRFTTLSGTIPVYCHITYYK